MKPVLQAIVLAERIYEDTTGKKVIAGTFNQLTFGTIKPPEVIGPDGTPRRLVLGSTSIGCPSLYVSLIDVVGETTVELELSESRTNKTIFGTTFRIRPKSRLDVIEIIAPLPPLEKYIKTAGVYSFDLIWNNEILGSHRLIARQLDELHGPPNPQREGEE